MHFSPAKVDILSQINVAIYKFLCYYFKEWVFYNILLLGENNYVENEKAKNS
jgi:hypothetical protein